jgi:uncharacterized protein YbcI
LLGTGYNIENFGLMFSYRHQGTSYRLPDFFIPGAAKSGTTTLYQLLSQHPDLFFPKSRKEPFFFSFGDEAPAYQDDQFNSIHVWKTKEYLDLYAPASASQLCGDASTSYLYTYQKTLPLIRQFYGDQASSLKSVILLRNPIDRAYSHYTYLIRNGFENRTFEEAISKSGIEIWKKKRWGFDYLEYGRYAKQVEAFQQAIPNTRIWLTEDLKKAETINEIMSFLGIQPIALHADIKANPSGIPKNRKAVDFLRKNALAKKIGKALPPSMQARLKNKRDKVMSKMLKKEPMKAQTRESLKQVYEKDVQKLEKLIQRDLNHWLET